METRVCERCGIEKSLEDFHRNKSRPLGRAYWCKVCTRANDRQRNRRPDRQDYVKRWEASDRGRELRILSRKADREANKQKNRARRILNKLVKEGLIKKMPCVECGETNSNGHHVDYSDPIAVVWLCRKHHAELNRKLTTE